VTSSRQQSGTHSAEAYQTIGGGDSPRIVHLTLKRPVDVPLATTSKKPYTFGILNALPFVKMHGTGNDFVLIGPEHSGMALDWPGLARATGDRHFGIGHDGLLLVERDDAADFRMRMLNPDGSESEMCGNGIRCFSKYVFDNGLARASELTIRTGAGIQKVRVLVDGGQAAAVEVDMGVPIFEAARIPVISDCAVVVNQPIAIDGWQFAISCASMGNPHAVAFVENVDRVPLELLGPKVEHHGWFPRRVNFEVATVKARDEVVMRVWERGAGITLACGSGACAVMAVAHRRGLVGDQARIRLPGGDLQLQWDGRHEMRMTGPASFVFRGEWPLS